MGLTQEQIQDAFAAAEKKQEVAAMEVATQDVPAAPADQPKQAIPTALEVAAAENKIVPNADDPSLEKAAATLDGTN